MIQSWVRRAEASALESSSGGGSGGFSYTRTGGGYDWLDVSQSSGTLSAGESIDVELTISAAELDGGIYESNISISSNDPVNA